MALDTAVARYPGLAARSKQSPLYGSG